MENTSNPISLYSVYTQPYYNPVKQQYFHIITINQMPPQSDPLSKIVKVLQTQRLSSFIQEHQKCVYAIYNPNNPDELIDMNTITIFFEYIINNGYSLHKTLTKIMNTNMKKDILCFIQKN